jgi:hypothetical protein
MFQLELGALGASLLGTWETETANPIPPFPGTGAPSRNPVVSGLVANPEGWPWSSFRHYATGVAGTVENESEWIAIRRGSQLPEHLRCAKKDGGGLSLPRSPTARDLGHPR